MEGTSLDVLSLYFVPKSVFVASNKLSRIETIVCIGLGLQNLIYRIGVSYATRGYDLFSEGIFRKALELQNASGIFRGQNKLRIAQTWTRLGDVYTALGRHNEAINSYQEAIATYPKYSFSWRGRASLYRNLGLSNEAISVYRKAIELSPKAPTLWNGLGNVYYDIGKYEDSLQAYKKAVELNPKAVATAIYWGNIGTLHQTNKNVVDAMNAYEKSIVLDPEYVYAILSLAICYKKTGESLEAEKLIDAAELLITHQTDYVQACFQVARTNIEDGLLLLKRSLDKQETSRVWAQKDPNFEIIRDDPRFKELVNLE